MGLGALLGFWPKRPTEPKQQLFQPPAEVAGRTDSIDEKSRTGTGARILLGALTAASAFGAVAPGTESAIELATTQDGTETARERDIWIPPR